MSFFRSFFSRKRNQATLGWEANTPPAPRAIPVHYDSEGRRHRSDTPYLLPKDEQEQERLNYQHHLLRSLLGSNTYAPVQDLLSRPCRVLDVGCGTGRWCSEMARSYPQSQVVGVDLEAPSARSVLPRPYTFEQANVLKGLPFPERHFHYVHQRLLVAAIPLARWPTVVHELKRVTAPGGWIELVEIGTGCHNCGPAMQQVLTWYGALSATQGIDPRQVSTIGAFLEQAGCVSVRATTKEIPVGAWGKRIGQLFAQDILSGWPAMRPAAQSVLGVTPETFNAVLGQLEEEWNRLQTSYEVYFACGQV